MWALSPETEGVSCGLGNTVADRLCRDPSLRSLKPIDLARMLGVGVQEAQAGILRLAEIATGRKAIGVRGTSFDEAIARRGHTSGRTIVEYSQNVEGIDDAGGGFATPAAPKLLPPGYQDPRTRSFTAAILDPNLVQQYGVDAVKQLGWAGLVPPPEDLDRVAVFAPPPINWPGQYFQWLDPTTWSDGMLPDGTYRSPKWSDVQKAGTNIGRPDLDDLAVKSTLAWWRQAYALGPLPEDEQGLDDPREESWNWPAGTANVFRRIYFWGYGKDGRLYKHMQLQKSTWDPQEFRIFNKYAQNLTFVFQPESGKWIAGWDFGDWFTQNKITIVKGLQLGMSAVLMCIPFANAAVGLIASTLFGVTSFGISTTLVAAIGGAVAAQQAFVAGMTAIAKGDLGEAFKYFSNMVTDLGNVPVNGDPKFLPPEFQTFANSPAVKGLAITIQQAGTAEIGKVIAKAAEIGGTIVKIGPTEIYAARAMIPPELVPWFDRAVSEGGAAIQRSVPWYAGGVHAFGAAIGTLADPVTVTGVKAPRTIVEAQAMDLSKLSMAELEDERAKRIATRDKVAATAYGQSHPALMAILQSNVDEVETEIAVRKNPNILAQGAVQSFRQWSATHPQTQPVAPAASGPSAAIAAPIAGGLLALLFFL